MSMPPPKPSPSKKREREDSEQQGGNEEKKGRAVQVQVQVPQAAEARTLTRWQFYVRPCSNKLKAVQSAQHAVNSLEQQKGKPAPYEFDQSKVRLKMQYWAGELDRVLPSGPTSDPVSAWEDAKNITRSVADYLDNRDLQREYIEKHVALNTARTLPDDFGSSLATIRTQLQTSIASLVRYRCYQFSQSQHRLHVQTLANWHVRGLCTPFCLEYIHWRRIKISPAAILELFKADATQGRMGRMQANYYEDFKKLQWIDKGRVSYPARDRLFSATLFAERERKVGKMFVATFNDVHDSLLQGHEYPISIAKKRLDFVGMVVRFDFSLETLEALRPPGRASIPAMRPYAVAESRSASSSDASSSSSSNSNPALGQFHLSTSNAADESQSDSEDIRLIKSDLKKYQTDFQALRHLILSNPEEPYVLINFNLVNEAVIATGTAGGMSGHAIVLDLSRDQAGIFDPNIGFLPLGSSVGAAVDMHELYWLLGLLLVRYDVCKLAFYALK